MTVEMHSYVTNYKKIIKEFGWVLEMKKSNYHVTGTYHQDLDKCVAMGLPFRYANSDLETAMIFPTRAMAREYNSSHKEVVRKVACDADGKLYIVKGAR